MSYVPLGIDTNEFRIAALDTGTVRHGLEKTTYAVRVKECQEFVAMLQRQGYKIQSLGDIKDRKTYVLSAERRLNNKCTSIHEQYNISYSITHYICHRNRLG